MTKLSAGILVYRVAENRAEVLLAHPGGPLWVRKDDGAWSIFKGEPEEGEALIDTARREFGEETGQNPPDAADLLPLTPIKRKDGKTIHAWAYEADYDPASIRSNTFSMQWPPRSGTYQEFPENDRAEWFDLRTAVRKLHTGQDAFIAELRGILAKKYPDLLPPQFPDDAQAENSPALF